MKTLLRRLAGARNRDALREFEDILGYRFRKRSWLEAAITHRSFRFENAGVEVDNQRLEFLGDAALGLAVGSYFFRRFDDKDEGWLTSLRSQVTSGDALARVARRLGIGKLLRLGRGEEKAGGRRRSSMLADAFEAVVGAGYMDGGIKAVDKIFLKAFQPELAALDGDVWSDNPKGKLQEYSQREFRTGPVYRLVRREGPAHAAVFTVEVLLQGRVAGRGTGSSKHEAEKKAAADALLRSDDPGNAGRR